MTTAPPEMDPRRVKAELDRLKRLMREAGSDDDARELARRIAIIARKFRITHGIGLPPNPVTQAQQVSDHYISRPHLEYISDRVAKAVKDVERGQNRRLAVSVPPRAGKSTLLSLHTPLWLLSRHPDWKIITASYDGALTKEWGTEARRIIEDQPDLGIALRPDGGSGAKWTTEEGGGLFATSVRGSMTGKGAKVILIDDPVKDFVEAHSYAYRNNVWNWWLSVVNTRLEYPWLAIVLMTRWHEDDLIGRLMSKDHEGDPADWEYIRLPAMADGPNDLLGRPEGEPLLSPLVEHDTKEMASARWEDTKRSVGTYVFSSMYQQKPAPAKGAIFDHSWWRFWTTDRTKVTDDGFVQYFDPDKATGAKWLDSWDCSFKSDPNTGDWVVGQRWVRHGANRYLISQARGRWSFTQTIEQMKTWAGSSPATSPYGKHVHQRVIEEKANGAAIIDTLKNEISGLKPINPTVSKESRARAITPEVESGNVLLPHPSDPGNEWVADLLAELRNFPYDAHDDQVDSLTQALSELRGTGRASVSRFPNRREQNSRIRRNYAQTGRKL